MGFNKRVFFLNKSFCALSAEKITWAALGGEKMLNNKLTRKQGSSDCKVYLESLMLVWQVRVLSSTICILNLFGNNSYTFSLKKVEV